MALYKTIKINYKIYFLKNLILKDVIKKKKVTFLPGYCTTIVFASFISWKVSNLLDLLQYDNIPFSCFPCVYDLLGNMELLIRFQPKQL
jgi:hypothetical protein